MSGDRFRSLQSLLSSGETILTALITYASFKELKIEIGMKVYATFKSSAIHCF
ncbi:MAG: TOBE domain-containing protein [Planctomycetota bacterium]